MTFFEIDPITELVMINKPWILLIPEFKLIYMRDKGSPGDAEGRKRLKAHKEFTFIYFYKDFTSPIRDWEPDAKYKEALVYSGITEKESRDKDLEIAIAMYERLVLGAARSLRTYNAMKKTLDAMDDYYENLDFTLKDKQGQLLNSPDKIAMNITKMGGVYDSLRTFEKRVEEDLKNTGTGIRGTAEKGDNEDRISDWSESDIARNSIEVSKKGDKTRKTPTPLKDKTKPKQTTFASISAALTLSLPPETDD